MDAARAAFERAYQIAAREEFAVRKIAALHELGTVDMLQGRRHSQAVGG